MPSGAADKKNPISGFFVSLYNKLRSYAKVFAGRAGLTIKGDFSPARKVLLTYVFIAVLLSGIAFYLIGSTITGESMMKQIDSLDSQLSDSAAVLAQTEQSLQASRENGRNLSSNLNSTKSDLAATSASLAFLRNAMTNTQSDLTSCQSNSTALKANITSLQNQTLWLQSDLYSCQNHVVDLNATVGNSVAAVCCSYGDVQAGVSKTWQITNNKIVCAGANTVNCTSGGLS